MNSKFYYSIFFTLLFFAGFNSQLEAQLTVTNNTGCDIYIGAFEGNCADLCNQNEIGLQAFGGTITWGSSFCLGPGTGWVGIKYGVGFPPNFFSSTGVSYNPQGNGGGVISPFPPGPCSQDQPAECNGNLINVTWTSFPGGAVNVEFN